MSRIFITLTILLAWISTIASAQSIPQYNGVYVRLTNGELIQLSASQTYRDRFNISLGSVIRQGRVIAHISVDTLRDEEAHYADRLRQNVPFWAMLDVFNHNQVTNIQAQQAELASIVVRSRNESVVFIEYLTHQPELMDRIRGYGGLTGLTIQQKPNSEWLVSEDFTYVRSYWGYNSNSGFREQILDNFTTEYVLNEGFRAQQMVSMGWQNASMNVVGFMVQTNEGFYPFRFSE